MIRYQFLRFPEGKAKALTFSYDDGCIEDPRLSDILSAHGLKGTFNLTGNAIRGKNALSKEVVVSKFLDRGHEIAVHGLNHRAEGNIRPIEGIRDVLDCRLELEERYEMIIRGMAYPDSGIRQFTNVPGYETVRHYLSELDIAYARTLGADNDSFDLPTDWLCWMPTCHHDQPKIFEWAELPSLDVTMRMAKELVFSEEIASSLFKHNGIYYLRMDLDCTRKEAAALSFKLAEYAGALYGENPSVCDVLEHGRVIIEENALQVLQAL